ncbi:MAG: DUF4097 domain-containing protein [Chitinophagaceae bacterium]|nr:DUF4097 domain-containing protein [Chitinophagaceae bacterium]MDP1762982.1 hypothetical protein [Sediminibacterium sp.]MDP1811836.1 hypothetical protein [Sediminibacterium sp.]MDP3127633.1 hypothetical protein [Sediminibacterium sp.]
MKKIILYFCTLIILLTGLYAQQPGASANTVGTLTRINTHTKVNEEDLKSKEISREMALPKNGEIYIDNTSRNIVIKTWNQPKVKITTTVFYEGESKIKEEEWFEKINLSLKTLGNAVKIKSVGIQGSVLSMYGIGSGTMNIALSEETYFNGAGQSIGTKANMKTTVTITVPLESKLDIENKYADMVIPDYPGNLNVDISYGNLEAGNLKNFMLRSKYSNINIIDAKEAEIELTNGRFSARNIDIVDFDTKNSTIELANTKKVVIRSANDEFEFEEAGEINGIKNYGNLRITKLTKSIELEGINADIKIRNITASVSLIKINDKYADIRIPLKAVQNFSVDFTGAYSAVYGNFEKKALAFNDKPTSTPSVMITVGRLTKPVETGTITPGKPVTTPTETGTLTSGKLMTTQTETATITSVGTLTNLTVSGHIVATNSEPALVPTNVTRKITGVPFPGGLNSGDGQNIIAGQTARVNGSNTSGTFRPWNRAYSYASYNDNPSKFIATVGDGKGLKIELKCPNCMVDFK